MDKLKLISDAVKALPRSEHLYIYQYEELVRLCVDSLEQLNTLSLKAIKLLDSEFKPTASGATDYFNQILKNQVILNDLQEQNRKRFSPRSKP